VRELGWNGKKNGELLGLMTLHGFEGFITVDKNLSFQQNINRFPLSIFLFDAPDNKIVTLLPYAEKLLKILTANPKKGLIIIKISGK
jgi:hypothetical protein